MRQPEKPIGTVRDLAFHRMETAASDYDDFYIATRTEAEEQIATAKELLELVRQHCDGRS